MNEQAIRFRIGIFVLAAFIALAVLIILLNGMPLYFLPSSTYTVEFDNAQGVAPGTPVKRSGVKIGEVRRVTLDDDTGRVEVLIQIDNGFKLRKSDRPTLVQSVLGGDAQIAFLPPAEKKDVDPTPIEVGSVLTGYTQADTGTLLQRTTDVIHPAEEALKEIKKTLERLTPFAENALDKIDKLAPGLDKAVGDFRSVMQKVDKMAPGAEKAVEELRDIFKKLAPPAERALDRIDKLGPVAEKTFEKLDKTADEIQVLSRTWNKVGERLDLMMKTNEDKLVKTLDRVEEVLKRVNDVFNDENQKNIQITLKNVRTTSDRFDTIAKNTDELLKDTQATLKTFDGSLQKIDKMVVDLQKVTKPLGDRGESIMKNVDEATDKLNRTLTDVRDLLQTVARGEGTVQKLLSDPALYNNLNEASLSLSRLMPRIDHILRDVEIFADKLARHPESLGIGGLVRPGSGVKESPSPYKVFPMYP